jgi:hypothetical protein
VCREPRAHGGAREPSLGVGRTILVPPRSWRARARDRSLRSRRARCAPRSRRWGSAARSHDRRGRTWSAPHHGSAAAYAAGRVDLPRGAPGALTGS